MTTHLLIASTVEEVPFLNKRLDRVHDVINLTLLVVKVFCRMEVIKMLNDVGSFILDQASKSGSVREYL
jgi:hypothetical protein